MRNDDGGLRSAALATKNATHLLKTTQKIAPATQNDFRRLECHKVPRYHAKRSYATFEASKSDRFCRTCHRHGHTALTPTLPDGCERCERLRTVANGCERVRKQTQSRANTLNPQPPRVKREPLLRIREKWKRARTRLYCTLHIV